MVRTRSASKGSKNEFHDEQERSEKLPSSIEKENDVENDQEKVVGKDDYSGGIDVENADADADAIDNDETENEDGESQETTEKSHHNNTVQPRRIRRRMRIGKSHNGNKSSSSSSRIRMGEKNELTHLIPGYVAPMKLQSSSLDKYRCDSMTELGRRAERNDTSTKDFVLEATVGKVMANNSTNDGLSARGSNTVATYSNFKRGVKVAKDDTAGDGWFNMRPSAMTEELKTDLAVIRNRTYLDPKRFYKSSDKNHKIIQMGTVVEGASEFYSSRLTKKQRRLNLTEELMADPSSSKYTKKMFKKMADEKSYQAKLRKPKKRAKSTFY